MKLPRPTRRWLRYSLRTLFVVVTLCAIACSWLAVKLRQSEREAVAAAAIAQAGGTVAWDDTEYPRLSAWLGRLLGENCLGHVIRVWWPIPRSSPEPFAADLESLDALSHLQELYLNGTGVSDAQADHLQGLRELKKLSIAGVGDAGLEKIAALSELEELSLFATKVTDVGLEKLTSLKKLKVLEFNYSNVTDAGLEKLTRLPKLDTLSLLRMDVTDAGLEHIQQMKQLRKVVVFETHATAAGLEKLQRALPDSKVQTNPYLD